ncbi:MobQ family relaxase [Metabacillus niabensis]|uniref:MobQ family relaxase n=1 Tax=Metabacillus niabensis TaxID=324854 RepID=UPI001CFA6A1F|nr:MobQ family relaxase [Metabacillus niabensis]
MAIFHFQVQILTRAKNQNAVASAAYRSGDVLFDEASEELKFYKRSVQPETMILAPSHAPEWVLDRNSLWNGVEKVEKNWNSQLAREINIALPRELSNDKQVELLQNFVQDQFVDKGMVADIAIHRDDQNNPHAHVMLTVRQFNENGEWGNKKKKEYQLDRKGNKVLDKNGKPKYKTIALTDWDKRDNVAMWREQWSTYANQMLEKEGVSERITHLSHEARGLDELPTVHLGHKTHAMEKRGIQTERGDINRNVEKHNAIVVEIKELQKKKEELERKEALEEKKKQVKSYYTSNEKLAIKKAEKELGEEANLHNVRTQISQIKDSEIEVNQNYKIFYNTSLILEEAKLDLSAIKSIETRIQEQQIKLDNAGFYDQAIKKESKNELEKLHGDLQYRTEMIKPTLEKLGLQNNHELNLYINKFNSQRSEWTEDNQKERKEILRQKEIFIKAEHALERGFVRKVTEPYAELGNTREFISFETALKMKELRDKVNKHIPLKNIQEAVANQKGSESALGLLEGIMKGIEEAQKQEQRENKKLERQRYRGQKQKQNQLER